MAEPKNGGFLSGLVGRAGDKFTWGQTYNPSTGASNASAGQVIGGVGSRLLNLAAPGLGSLVNMVGNGYYGSGPLANIFASMRQPGLDRGLARIQGDMAASIAAKSGGAPLAAIGPVERLGITAPGQVAAPNLQPQMGGAVNMPAVQAEAPWTGSLAQRNPFGGSYGSNLGFSSPQAHTYSGQSGFVSSSPYFSAINGQAARDFASSMRGPTLSRRLFEIY